MNDSVNTSDEEEFQSSSEDIEIKPWDLPYWRGGPKQEKKQEKEESIEEDIEVVEPLTVEELEAIRNEGYEEGFLQGLNEGREKGELAGKEEGLISGKEEGRKQGKQEGNRIGFEAGEVEGLASGKEEINLAAANLAQLTQQLEQSLTEKDAALPQVLTQLIKAACETIIERELEQGDNQITQKVISALDQLPSGAENIQVFISSEDALHLEHGLSSTGREMHFDIDNSLTTGSARIVTKQSLIEFSHGERMQKVFELIESQCEKLDLSDIEGEAEEGEPEAEEVDEEADAEIELDLASEAEIEDSLDAEAEINIEQQDEIEQQQDEIEQQQDTEEDDSP